MRIRFLILAIFTMIANTYDALHTAYYLNACVITEANPLMKVLIDNCGIIGLLVFKLLFVNMLILILWVNEHNKIARLGIYVISFCYFLLVLWQAQIFFI